MAEWRVYASASLDIIGSDNGLSPVRRQAIIRTNAGISFIWTLGTMFSEILIEIHTFSVKKMHLKMSAAKRRPFCLGLNAINKHYVLPYKECFQGVMISDMVQEVC